MLLPDAPNICWSLDFVSDALTDGRRFRLLTLVDGYNWECLALVADTSLSGHRVVRELDAGIARPGHVTVVVSDNGMDLTSMALWSRRQRASVDWRYVAPRKSMQNGFVESFNGRLRDECLNEYLFVGRRPVGSEQWRLNGRPCPPVDRGTARRLQPSPPAHEPRRAHPVGLLKPVREGPDPEQT